MLVLFTSLLFGGCARGESPAASPSPTTAAPSSATQAATLPATPQGPTIDLRFGDNVLHVEIADTNDERQLGLMHRSGLAPDHGMVFVYPSERMRGFWMHDTLIPLSIAFADGQGRIVRIADMQPLDESTTWSNRPAMYAVEAEQGWFASHGVTVGSKIEGLPAPSRE